MTLDEQIIFLNKVCISKQNRIISNKFPSLPMTQYTVHDNKVVLCHIRHLDIEHSILLKCFLKEDMYELFDIYLNEIIFCMDKLKNPKITDVIYTAEIKEDNKIIRTIDTHWGSGQLFDTYLEARKFVR